ncbi:hypothetical protein Q31a_19160 [Aureliella helgolandensis]|uniref:Uncharacterized protein n=1 Tax=Aureliella helgolandensis TaxID=2527968 RepID=A0A518G4U2_9BACT|nr:hypothetical protein Q31a_19160 [Aureliella helgolandensis]
MASTAVHWGHPWPPEFTAQRFAIPHFHTPAFDCATRARRDSSKVKKLEEWMRLRHSTDATDDDANVKKWQSNFRADKAWNT